MVYEIHCSRQVYFLKFKRQSNSQGLFSNQCELLRGISLSGKIKNTFAVQEALLL